MATQNHLPEYALRVELNGNHGFKVFLRNTSSSFKTFLPELRLTEYGRETKDVSFGDCLVGENPIHLGFRDERTHIFSFGSYDDLNPRKCGYYIGSSRPFGLRANVRIVEDGGERAWIHFTETIGLPPGAEIELLRDFTPCYGVWTKPDGTMTTRVFDTGNNRF